MRAWLKAFAVLAVAALGWQVATGLRFGEPGSAKTDEYYLAHAQEETGANNVVTAIVFDYRGFDTLGEATVLFTAVLGTGLALRRTRKGEEGEE